MGTGQCGLGRQPGGQCTVLLGIHYLNATSVCAIPSLLECSTFTPRTSASYVSPSCYSTCSQRQHRCGPLRVTLKISTARKSGHAQVLLPHQSAPFRDGSSPPPNTRFLPVPLQSPHTKYQLDRFIRFCRACASDHQTHEPRYIVNNIAVSHSDVI